MKNIEILASVLNGSNKVVSASEADWSAIREGSLFKFKDDQVVYFIAKTESLMYIKDFVVPSANQLVVSDVVVPTLAPGDTLNITFKVNEALYAKLVSAGSGYQPGDTLFVEGGTPFENVQDGISYHTRILVTEVGDSGEIKSFEIQEKGKYVIDPPIENLVKGGFGKGAKFNITLALSDIRGQVFKEVEKIQILDSKSYITLSYGLPTGVSHGKLSVNKWMAYLQTPYCGTDKNGELFDVSRDFTPNLKLPLLVKNSLSQEVIFNNAMLIIDRELAALRAKM